MKKKKKKIVDIIVRLCFELFTYGGIFEHTQLKDVGCEEPKDVAKLVAELRRVLLKDVRRVGHRRKELDLSGVTRHTTVGELACLILDRLHNQ
jgi:hypothetical protein